MLYIGLIRNVKILPTPLTILLCYYTSPSSMLHSIGLLTDVLLVRMQVSPVRPSSVTLHMQAHWQPITCLDCMRHTDMPGLLLAFVLASDDAHGQSCVDMLQRGFVCTLSARCALVIPDGEVTC